MIHNGGIEEARHILNGVSDYEVGVAQSIGYKELIRYINGH